MSSSRIKHFRLIITLCIGIALAGGTLIAIQFAKGYRPISFKNPSIQGTGLLSVTSYPKSAQVYINDRLTTVTDDTLYLAPGDYTVKIVKTGLQPWTKTLPLKTELVTLTDARLFPSIPSFTPLTFYQVNNPITSPDGNKIAYVLSGSPFSQDNGLYVLSFGNSFLGNQTTQITGENRDYTKADLAWSPDSSQILAVFHDATKISAAQLLNAKSLNQSKNIVDVTVRLPQILNQWQDQLIKINQSSLAHLPDFMVKIASESAVNVYFSPDREKFLYTATQDGSLPENTIGKNLPNINSTPEIRDIKQDKTYVYDIKEGTNYQINEAVLDSNLAQPILTANQTPSPSPTTAKNAKKTPIVDPLLKHFSFLKAQVEPTLTQNLSWYSTNRHLVVVTDDGVSIVEYDDNNLTPITSAKLANRFAVATPDGNHLIILSNLNQKPDTFNLLSLDLK